MKRTLLYMMLLQLLWVDSAAAHGTQGLLEERNGICVVARYDDGEPMAFGNVLIFAPHEETEFQSGLTDRNGVFLFRPDKEGKWRIEVNDGMGHRLVLSRQISTAGLGATVAATVDRETAPVNIARRDGALAGLGILFGLSGFFYALRQRALRQRWEQKHD